LAAVLAAVEPEGDRELPRSPLVGHDRRRGHEELAVDDLPADIVLVREHLAQIVVREPGGPLWRRHASPPMAGDPMTRVRQGRVSRWCSRAPRPRGMPCARWR